MLLRDIKSTADMVTIPPFDAEAALFQCASLAYLSKPTPLDFFDLPEDEMDRFIEEHKRGFLKDCSVCEVLGLIVSYAYRIADVATVHRPTIPALDGALFR